MSQDARTSAPAGGGSPPVGQPIARVGAIVPWWRNQLFAGTIGAAILAALNGRLHWGLPSSATAGLTIGLAVMWGLHTVLLDLEALRLVNRPTAFDDTMASWASKLDAMMPEILQAMLGQIRPAGAPAMSRRTPNGGRVIPIPQEPAKEPPPDQQPTGPTEQTPPT